MLYNTGIFVTAEKKLKRIVIVRMMQRRAASLIIGERIIEIVAFRNRPKSNFIVDRLQCSDKVFWLHNTGSLFFLKVALRMWLNGRRSSSGVGDCFGLRAASRSRMLAEGRTV